MAKEFKTIAQDGFSSKILQTGLSTEGTFQKGLTSANLQSALKPTANVPNQNTSGGGTGGSSDKK